jgi:chromosome segregation ATPase
MMHQRNQLKEEIQQKDGQLIAEHFRLKRLDDELKVMKKKLDKRRAVLQTADKVLQSQDKEIKNLRKTLSEASLAQQQQKRVYDVLVQERVRFLPSLSLTFVVCFFLCIFHPVPPFFFL